MARLVKYNIPSIFGLISLHLTAVALMISFALASPPNSQEDILDKQIVLDIITQEEPLTASIEGFSGVESFQGEGVRWVHGPVAEIRHYSSADKFVTLELSCANPFADQTITIEANGKQLSLLSLPSVIVLPERFEYKTLFKLRKGENVLRLRFAKWNEGKNMFAPADSRKMALLLTRLRIVGPSVPPKGDAKINSLRISDMLLYARQALDPPKVFDLLNNTRATGTQLIGVRLNPGFTNTAEHSAYGRETRALVLGEAGQLGRVDFSLRSDISGQVAHLSINGRFVESVVLGPVFTGHSRPFTLRHGYNEILITYDAVETTLDAPYPIIGRPSSYFLTLKITIDSGRSTCNG